MLLSSLPPDHEIRFRCEQCGRSGSISVGDLREELGEYDDLELDRLCRGLGDCCGHPLKVDLGLH